MKKYKIDKIKEILNDNYVSLKFNPIVKTFIIALIYIIIFVFLFVPPATIIIGANDHDRGSQAAIEYWTQHRFQYGKDIVQNVGPLGFINYPSLYTGFLDIPKLFITLLLTGIFIFLLLKISKSLPTIIRIPFLLLTAFFAQEYAFAPQNPFMQNHVMFYLLSLFLSYVLLYTTRLRTVLLATLLLSLLVLMKGTYFFIALFIITIAVINNLFSRHYLFAICTVSAFIAFVLAIWLFVGQPFINFPAFVHSIVLFSSGYNEAMVIFESRKFTILGFIVLFGSLLPIFWGILNSIIEIRADSPRMVRRLLLSAIDFLILFIVWKHGFLRAPTHMVVFFQYAIISCIWILFRKEPPYITKNNTHNMPVRVSIALIIIIVSASLMALIFEYHIGKKMLFVKRFQKVGSTLSKICNMPANFKKLNMESKRIVETIQLPNTRALVGNKPISYFGIFPAVMLYNDFNYISIPSTISFAAWNEWIMKKDAFFLRDDNQAPEYLLLDLYAIDERLVAQDSSLAQLEILHRYNVVSVEKGNILLHRIKKMTPFIRKQISRRDYEIGNWIDVPQRPFTSIWVKVRIYEGFLTRIVALAYKPPQYSIEMLLKNGDKKMYKFIPIIGAVGFLIDPLITDNNDALAVHLPHQHINGYNSILNKVVKFRIICNKLKTLAGRRVTVSFEDIYGLIPSPCDNLKKN